MIQNTSNRNTGVTHTTPAGISNQPSDQKTLSFLNKNLFYQHAQSQQSLNNFNNIDLRNAESLTWNELRSGVNALAKGGTKLIPIKNQYQPQEKKHANFSKNINA